jgi:hypothetical protein
MKTINIFLVVLSIFFFKESLSVSFFGGPSPYERLRYNKRFCKGNLDRVVFAVLKKAPHRGCLKAGLSKLQKRQSKLYLKFQYTLRERPDVRWNNGAHNLETKDILIRSIQKRLGQSLIAKDPRLTQTTKYGKKLLGEDIASFCARMGDHSLLDDSKKEEKAPNKKMDAHLVLSLIEKIDIYKALEEYRRFLSDLEGRKGIKEEEKKEALRDAKSMRKTILSTLDRLVILKKRLSQKEGSYKHILSQREAIKDVLVSVASERRKQESIERAMAVLDPDYSKETRGAESHFIKKYYLNFYFLNALIRNIDKFNTRCLLKH